MKSLVSDNAAVGNSCVKTVSFPQYYVDQGLAEVFIMIFLENNHGKYAADMLFGQFRTKNSKAPSLAWIRCSQSLSP